MKAIHNNQHSTLWQKISKTIRHLITPIGKTPPFSIEYRQERALNMALLVMIIVGIFSILPSYSNISDISSWVIRLIISSSYATTSLVCYLLARRGFWRISARLLIYSQILVTASFAIHPHPNSYIELAYLLFVVAWALFFVNWAEWLGVMVLNLTIIIIFAWLTPSSISFIDILRGIFLFHVAGNALLIVARLYQENTYQRYMQSLELVANQLRRTMESDLDGIFLLQAVRDANNQVIDFRLMEVNSAGCNQLNMTRDQLIGRLICELFPINRTNGFFEQYKRVIETGEPLLQEYQIPDTQIGAGWYKHQVVRVDEDSDNLVIYNRDNTQQKQYELDLVKQRNQLQSLIESQTSYLVRTDIYGKYVYANQRFIDHFDMNREKIIGSEALSTIYEQDWDKVRECVQQCMENPGHPVSITFRKPHRDGRLLWTDWEFIAIQDDMGHIIEIQAVGLDATSRVLAEEARIETQALRIALEKQAELNEIKIRMMRRISHEFRTPLSIILSSTNLLDNYSDQMSKEKRDEKMSHIYAEIDRLTQMLSDMARILQGQLDYTFSPVLTNVSEMIRKIIARYQLSDPTHQHPIVFVIPDNFPLVTIDNNLLDIILNNLLSNALKYSPELTPVTIEIKQIQTHLVLTVNDKGIGILESELEHIFDPFYRGSNFGEVAGIGLGLSLVKNAVETHGGAISVMSKGGEGTTFTVTLPLS
ncbi:MAG: ATP-binding protein [bacterium]|nr:ATP-binding protein [bacterium]